VKPEQLFEFKRDLEELLRAGRLAPLEAGVSRLFEKYELAATVRRRRGCQTPPVPLASDSAPPRQYLSGHRTYTGRPLWMTGGGSKDLAWCPSHNALVWRHTWYSNGDNYHGVREASGGSVKVQTPGRLLETLRHARHHLRVCWTPEELERVEAPGWSGAPGPAGPPPAHRWPDENGGILSDRDLKTLRPTERFSQRVENYLRYRPGYPAGLLRLMRDELGLGPGSAVADVGSGTGILSQLLLTSERAEVYAVEPNREMREAAESLMRDEPRFHSVDGTAEATTLPDGGVDIVACGQSFHWFDWPRAGAEFRRILKPGGHAVLVWNDRRVASTPFLRDFDLLLREFGTDYKAVVEGYMLWDEESARALREFFGGDYKAAGFDNSQALDFEGLRGRVLSASYMPLPGDERHEPMLSRLRAVFDQHQRDGRVTIEYDTNVYYGTLR